MKYSVNRAYREGTPIPVIAGLLGFTEKQVERAISRPITSSKITSAIKVVKRRELEPVDTLGQQEPAVDAKLLVIQAMKQLSEALELLSKTL